MTDRGTVRSVIRLLGALAIIGSVGVIALTALGAPAASIAVVVGLAATPAGALASVLVSTRESSSEPQPVTVENKPNDPVPVEAK